MFSKNRTENGHCLNYISELQQEEFYGTGQVERIVRELGKDLMLIYQGGPPVQDFQGKFIINKGMNDSIVKSILFSLLKCIYSILNTFDSCNCPIAT